MNMKKNRTVNIDLYNILKDSEVHAGFEGEEAILYALIDFNDLKDFTELLGEDYFCDGGVDVELHNGYIAIRIDDIIEEDFETDIESYRDVIGEYEYNLYLEHKKRQSKI